MGSIHEQKNGKKSHDTAFLNGVRLSQRMSRVPGSAYNL